MRAEDSLMGIRAGPRSGLLPSTAFPPRADPRWVRRCSQNRLDWIPQMESKARRKWDPMGITPHKQAERSLVHAPPTMLVPICLPYRLAHQTPARPLQHLHWCSMDPWPLRDILDSGGVNPPIPAISRALCSPATFLLLRMSSFCC